MAIFEDNSRIVLKIKVEEELNTAAGLELVHDLQDFCKENPGKYKIVLSSNPIHTDEISMSVSMS